MVTGEDATLVEVAEAENDMLNPSAKVNFVRIRVMLVLYVITFLQFAVKYFVFWKKVKK